MAHFFYMDEADPSQGYAMNWSCRTYRRSSLKPNRNRARHNIRIILGVTSFILAYDETRRPVGAMVGRVLGAEHGRLFATIQSKTQRRADCNRVARLRDDDGSICWEVQHGDGVS